MQIYIKIQSIDCITLQAVHCGGTLKLLAGVFKMVLILGDDSVALAARRLVALRLQAGRVKN